MVARRITINDIEIDLDHISKNHNPDPEDYDSDDEWDFPEMDSEKVEDNDDYEFMQMYKGQKMKLYPYDDVKNISTEIIITDDSQWDLNYGFYFEDSEFGTINFSDDFCSTGFDFVTIYDDIQNEVIKDPIKTLTDLIGFVKKLIKEKRIPEISLDLTYSANCCS